MGDWEKLAKTSSARAPRPDKSWVMRGLVSVSLLLVVLYGINLRELPRVFASIHYYYLGLILLLSLADRFLMAYKWSLLVRVTGISLSMWDSLKAYLISGFFGAFLPTSIGGDVYRVYHVSKRERQTEKIVASVVVERGIGIVASATFALFGITLMIASHSQYHFEGTIVMALLGLLGVSTAGFWVSMHAKPLSVLERLLDRWKGNRLVRKALQCYHAYIAYKQFSKVLLAFFLLSVVEQSLFSIMNYWAARAINLNVGLIYFIAVIPVCHILMRLPISINAIGVQEGLYVFFFSRLGMSATEAFSLALLIRMVWLIVHLGSAVLYIADGSGQKQALHYPVR